jgi:uncharacterized membrane protein YidH (DUF202 family)
MFAPTDVKAKADLADYLAAERTFLAWVRTGPVLMEFVFVVARLGFVRAATRSFPAGCTRILLRTIVVVWHSAHRRRSVCESLARMVPCSLGP